MSLQEVETAVCFAHGSNLRKEVFRQRFGEPSGADRAVLPDYEVYFFSPNGNDLKKKKGATVYGAAYRLTTSQLKRIDEWKKTLSDFETIKVIIDVESEKFPAFTQVLKQRRKPVEPSADYLELILAGLQEHGWSENALETWRRAAHPGRVSRIGSGQGLTFDRKEEPNH